MKELITFITCLLVATTVSAKQTKIPDYTKGDKPPEKARGRVMGPTGLWGHSHQVGMWSGGTRDARQFLISNVDPGSPADGKIMIGDVILGVDGADFTSDARRILAAAIHKAEEGDGKLTLRVWRPSTELSSTSLSSTSLGTGRTGRTGKGETSSVTLNLTVLGKYDPTSPYDCPYTDALIKRMGDFTKTQYLPPERAPKGHKLPKGEKGIFLHDLYVLGMLATGRDDLLPKIRAYAHTLCFDQKTGKQFTCGENQKSWRAGYKLIFLSEYYLATGDETVLPTIKEWAVGTAKGASEIGAYGHRFATPPPYGSTQKRVPGYGEMNNPMLTCLIGLTLAKEAGIEDEAVNRELELGKRYFDFYVEHGTIPYGDHWAHYNWFDNNGVNAAAAILYELMGDARGQRYWSAMTVGSATTGREEGHQGCYWSHLFGGLGAARAGKDGLNAFTEEMRFIQTLERRWNGQVYDNGNIKPKYSSRGDITGERLLQMTLGKKTLMLTGKKMKIRNPISGTALRDALEGGRLNTDEEALKTLSEDRIFELLEHELPPVRMVAARALQVQKLNRVDRLMTMLRSSNRYARYGACHGLSMAGFESEEAAQLLVDRIEKDDDPIFRYYAIEALAPKYRGDTGIYNVSHVAVPVLVKLAAEPVPAGERGRLRFIVANRLGAWHKRDAGDPRKKISDDDIVAAVKQILACDHGHTRSQVRYEQLSESQIERLWEPIIAATKDWAPGGGMWSTNIRKYGLTVLAQHRAKEGLDYMMELVQLERNHSNGWVPWFVETMFEVLPNYGKHAEPVVAIIEQWPLLEGRGKTFKEMLPELKAKLSQTGKVELRTVTK